MKNLNLIKKALLKQNRKLSVLNSSRLLAEFFDGVVIEINEENKYYS